MLEKNKTNVCDLQVSFFLAIFSNILQELVAKIKEEGNQCFKNGSYGDALGKYFDALKLCREHSLKTEGARIRSNCAQACMKMGMYDDAYSHCNECIQLDPTFDKVKMCLLSCSVCVDKIEHELA